MITARDEDIGAHLTTRSVLVLRPLVSAAAALGIDVDAALAEVGVTSGMLANDDARLEMALSNRVVTKLTERCPGVPLGLEAARRARLGELGVFDYLISSSSTLREATALAAQFFRLLDDSCEFVLSEREGTARYTLAPRIAHVHPPALAEFALANIVLTTRAMVGRELPGTEVRFAHRCNTEPRAYAELFTSTPIVFGASQTELVFPRVYLALELPRASSTVRSALTQCATELLARDPAPSSFIDRVRQIVSRALADGDVALASLAHRLGTSSRTLQRKLRLHGTSYEALIEETRRELAVHLVSDADLPIVEVARRVGFADAGAFARAFRRWTAMSPTAFRASPAAVRVPA